MSNDLVTIQPDNGSPYAIMPVLDLEVAAARRQAVVNYMKRLMVEKVDYGTIPGTGDKPTLLKPGAEKLASLFGLTPDFDPIETVLDWTGDAHGGEPFFFIRYRCTLRRGDMAVGQGIGSCNSWEKKYRWRNGERLCPECGQPAIIKGKSEYGGGWLCFKKKGGCGYKFPDGDGRIESQQVGQVKNPDAADVVNTIDKMAQKRALVAAVLIAVNASELFTQDVEDYSDVIDGEWQPAPNPNVRPAVIVPPGQKPNTPAPAKPAAQPATVDPGPMPDDELTVYEAPAADFLKVTAAILETDGATLKAHLKALGYSGVPGVPEKRLAAYRALKAATDEPPAAAHDELLFPMPAVDPA